MTLDQIKKVVEMTAVALGFEVQVDIQEIGDSNVIYMIIDSNPLQPGETGSVTVETEGLESKEIVERLVTGFGLGPKPSKNLVEGILYVDLF
ncbi:hypothetical protein IOQ59_10950 [Pontibacterium sp. N1Y112]|uniref:Uncharacterized protein n=1 Tax=Pontibacterium sinense TaxID=2781979 RepID=A0A8J7K610_9GAMM|nr:hypothetical protein [Pontibacterium sinense]MBE9397775.1 hypothetical protein [Pontibacterium sinense]